MTIIKCKRIVSIIVLVILSIVALCSCNSKSGDGIKIHGMSEDAYISTMRSIVETIYAPESEEDFHNVKGVFKEYADVAVYEKFTSVAPDFENEKYTSDIQWVDSSYGDGKYQDDGSDVLLLHFIVVRNYKNYDVNIEFKINDEGMVYDYSVY